MKTILTIPVLSVLLLSIVSLSTAAEICIPDSMPCDPAGLDAPFSDAPGCCSGKCVESGIIEEKGKLFCASSVNLRLLDSENMRESFNAFKKKFPSRPALLLGYSDDYSYKQFIQNTVIASQIQAAFPGQQVEFSAAESPQGDLNPVDLRRSILLPPIDPQALTHRNEVQTGAPKQLRGEDTPDSWDWNEKGAVTPVRDQGALGTCWAFSATGNVEGQLYLKKGKLKQLSVEQLIECDSTSDPSNPDADCGEFGGWPYLSFEYMVSVGGMVDEASFPYCAGELDPKTQMPLCFPCMADKYNLKKCGDHSDLYCRPETTRGQGKEKLCQKLKEDTVALDVRVTDWRSIGTDEDEIATELVSTGPLSIALNAQLLSFYRRGVFHPPKWLCNPANLDHAVLLTGFGNLEKGTVAYSRRLFNAKRHTSKYWIVKNSWGDHWGESGFFRIARGVGACGMNTAVSTSVLG